MTNYTLIFKEGFITWHASRVGRTRSEPFTLFLERAVSLAMNVSADDTMVPGST